MMRSALLLAGDQRDAVADALDGIDYRLAVDGPRADRITVTGDPGG